MNTVLPFALTLLFLSLGMIFRLKGDYLALQIESASLRETTESACALFVDFFMTLTLATTCLFAPGAGIVSTIMTLFFGGVFILQAYAFCITVQVHSEDLMNHFWENKWIRDQFYQC